MGKGSKKHRARLANLRKAQAFKNKKREVKKTRPPICLICSFSCVPSMDNDIISFFSEEILGIPKVNPNAADNIKSPIPFINLCENCIPLVQQTHQLTKEMQILQRRIQKIKIGIATTVKESEPPEEAFTNENSFVCKLYQDIRHNFCKAALKNKKKSRKKVKEVPIAPQESSEFQIETGNYENEKEIKEEVLNDEPEPQDQDFDFDTNQETDNEPNSSEIKPIDERLRRMEKIIQDNCKTLAQLPSLPKSSTSNVNQISDKPIEVQLKESAKKLKKAKANLKTSSQLPKDANGNFTCTEQGCERSYLTERGLKIHLVREHKHNPVCQSYKTHECPICHVQIKYSLAPHIRKHTGEMPFKCPEEGCDRAYANGTVLKHHIRSAHTKERPYVCKTCSKGFFTSIHLRRHEELHTGIKSHLCSTCGKAFISHNNLYIHMWSHDPDRKKKYSAYKPKTNKTPRKNKEIAKKEKTSNDMEMSTNSSEDESPNPQGSNTCTNLEPSSNFNSVQIPQSLSVDQFEI